MGIMDKKMEAIILGFKRFRVKGSGSTPHPVLGTTRGTTVGKLRAYLLHI